MANITAIDHIAGDGVRAVASLVHGGGGSSGSGRGTGLLSVGPELTGTIVVVATAVGARLLIDDALDWAITTTISSMVAVDWAGVDVGEEGQGDADNLRIEED